MLGLADLQNGQSAIEQVRHHLKPVECVDLRCGQAQSLHCAIKCGWLGVGLLQGFEGCMKLGFFG
ncbi:hypothetical protein D3C87_1959210 [compost metagenome]